jgi:multidrug efflux system membrane fusion protein
VTGFKLTPLRWRAIGIVLVLLLVIFAAWRWSASREGAPGGRHRGGAGQPITVGVAHVGRIDMPIRLAAIGTVQPLTTATVRTQIAGTLFSLHFTEGQMVAKGQLIAQIDPRPYKLALAQARANLARDLAQRDMAATDLKRYQGLLAQDSIARQQVETQAATLKQLDGTIGADRAAIGTAALNLAYTSIRAPVSGRIGLRQVDIGNYVTPSDTTGLAVITQIDPIDVTFSLPQNQIATLQARLASGGEMPVNATDSTGASTLAQGRFLTLDNQIDPTSGTVKAKARFGNGGGALFPSQFVNVSAEIGIVHQGLAVPVNSVRHGANGDFVFVIQPDRTVKLTLVKLGPSDGTNIIVASGLPQGAMVVTDGADTLDDGASVTLPGKQGTGGGRGGTGQPGGGHRHRHGAGQ